MRLIDADALSETMYHEAFETDTPMQRWDGGCWIRYKMFETAVENAPTVEPEQPERKKGEWIHKPDIYLDEQTWECSECGEPWIFIEGTPSENNANFCPNCGSYNGGEEECMKAQ